MTSLDKDVTTPLRVSTEQITFPPRRGSTPRSRRGSGRIDFSDEAVQGTADDAITSKLYV